MPRTRHANRFSTELTAQMSDTALEAQVLTTAGGPPSPCYLVIDHDVPASVEIILFDGTFDGTTFRTTALANRYLEGSAASSGITHAVGAKVISAPLGTSIEDIWDFAETGNVLGGTASATGVAAGPTASASGDDAVAAGSGATASGIHGVAVGLNAQATATNTAALGNIASATHAGSTAIGSGAATTATEQVRLGGPANATSIPGSLSVAGTKNFEIPHPLDPARTVRHGAYEGPVPGGTVYRYRVTVEGGTATVDLPDYFAALNKDVDVHVSPVGHFGRAYGDVAGQTLTVTADTDGEYAVLILGTRNDQRAQQAWETYRDTKPADRMWNGNRPDEVPT